MKVKEVQKMNPMLVQILGEKKNQIPIERHLKESKDDRKWREEGITQ